MNNKRFAIIIPSMFLAVLLAGCGRNMFPFGQFVPPPEINQGRTYLSQNNVTNATAKFNAAIAKSPSNPYTYELICQATSEFNHPELTIYYANNGLSACPKASNFDKAQLTNMIGMAYHSVGNLNKALIYYKAAYNLLPNDPMMMNNLGYTYADMPNGGENLDEALSLTQKAVSTARAQNASNSDIGIMLDSLGWVYYKKGDYPNACLNLERAVALAPDKAAIHYHLGAVYAKMNRVNDAIVEMQRTLCINPSDNDAKTQLKSLQELANTPNTSKATTKNTNVNAI